VKTEHDISNSFFLEFKNTTPDRQDVEFFELGTTGNNVPLASQRANSDVPFANLTGGTAWQYSGTLPVDNDIVQLDNNLLVADSGLSMGAFIISYSDGSTENIGGVSGLISDGDSVTTILGFIHTTLVTKNSLNENDITCEALVQYGLDGDEVYITWSIYYNVPLTTIPFTVTNFNYTNPAIITCAFPPNPSSTEGTWTSGVAITPNGVEVNAQGDITYEELKQTQNGSSYKINTININSQNEIQLLNSIQFDYKDSTGNQKVHVANPLIDPYQFQQSIMDIDVGDVSLEGETQLKYSIEGNALARVTFNYTQVKNIDLKDLSFTEMSKKAVSDEQQQAIDVAKQDYNTIYQLENDYRLSETYHNLLGKQKDNKINMLLLGLL